MMSFPKRIFDFAYIALEKYPKENAFCTKNGDNWESISTAEYILQANKVSRGLIRMGLKRGDKVGIITNNNRTEWAIMDIGMLQIGIVNVPVYPTISVDDYVYIFNNAEIKYCFVSDIELYNKLISIQNKIPNLRKIFTFDSIEKVPNWKDILKLGEDESNQKEVENVSRGIKPEDTATIIFTSGTTGSPKGVVLSHENIVSNVINACPKIPDINIDYKDVKILSFLPLCHVFERMIMYLFFYNGFSIYFAESIEKIGENLQEVKPHFMSVVPRVLEKFYDKIYKVGTSGSRLKRLIFIWAISLIEDYEFNQKKGLSYKIADRLVFKKFRQALGGNIVTLVSGSATLYTKLNKIFHGVGIPILEGYGLTETSPVITVNSFKQRKFGSVGVPLDNVRIKIAKDGEILVKGSSVFKEYYLDQEKTKEAFTDDGYFKTGDIGNLDSDGFLNITDRKKEIFKTSGGKYIAPQVIENKAKSSKFIENIMIVGDGEKMPAALIQPDFDFIKSWIKRKNLNIGGDNAEISTNENVKLRIAKEIDKLNSSLGKWEQIKRFELTPIIWTIEEGLITPTLKLRRKIIKEKFIDLYNKIYNTNK